jgi:tetratricopeptide (TPR) repeat protein
MLRNLFLGLAMTVTIAAGSTQVFAADPTISQVYQAAEAGKFAQAQQMMDQVLRDHPNSGKAHFAEAELLAKEGRINQARTELASAERLEPGLPFAKPAAVQELKSLLAANVSRAAVGEPTYAAAPAFTPSGLPWGLIFLVLAANMLIVYFFNRRAKAAVPAGPDNLRFGGTYNAGVPSYGGPMPMTPAGGGMGSGILGGLATGAAVGAGIVAGETLMHHVFDGNGQATAAPLSSGDWNNPAQTYDMGGNDFGLTDDSSWDDAPGGSSGDDDWN